MMESATMTAGTGERLQRIAAGPAREEVVPLLLLADDSELQVRSYYQQGDLFVLCGDDGIVMGITLAIPHPGNVELKVVVVAPALQGRGVGQRMVRMVLADTGWVLPISDQVTVTVTAMLG